jgi:hypothetical protein
MRVGGVTASLSKTDLYAADFQTRWMNFAGRNIPVKQTVSWTPVSCNGKLGFQIKGSQLCLVRYDFKGAIETNDLPARTLALSNSDFEQLVVPGDDLFICRCAEEWLEKIEDRLILKINKFQSVLDLDNGLLDKMLTLYAGIEPESQKSYGILLLNGWVC